MNSQRTSDLLLVLLITAITVTVVMGTGIVAPHRAWLVLSFPLGLAFVLFAWYRPHPVALLLVALIPLDAFARLPGALHDLSLFKLIFPLPLVILVLGLLLRRFANPPNHPLDRWLLGWTVLYLFLIPLAPDRSEALDFCRRWISMALFYFVLTRLFDSPERYITLVHTLLWATLLSCLIGVVTWLIGDNPFTAHQDSTLFRSTGATGDDPNSYALSLFLPLWIAVAAAWSARSRKGTVAYQMIAIIIAVSIMLTYSRSAFVVLSLMSGAALILWYRKFTPVHWGVLGIALAVGLGLLPDSFWERVASLGQVLNENVAETSLWRRGNYLKVGWNILKEHPFWGVGPGSFSVLHADPVYQPENALVGVQRLPHNVYLQVLTETGGLGFCFFMGTAGTALITVWHVLRQNGPRGHLAGALLLTLIGYAAMGLFLHFLLAKLFWITLVLVRNLNMETIGQIPEVTVNDSTQVPDGKQDGITT